MNWQVSALDLRSKLVPGPASDFSRRLWISPFLPSLEEQQRCSSVAVVALNIDLLVIHTTDFCRFATDLTDIVYISFFGTCVSAAISEIREDLGGLHPGSGTGSRWEGSCHVMSVWCPCGVLRTGKLCDFVVFSDASQRCALNCL